MKDKINEKDVGMANDMMFLLKNLLGAEEHSAISYAITKESKWAEALKIVRELRTKWMSPLVKKETSEIWCFSKHILASSEALIEVGNRFLSTGQQKESKEAFKDATNLMILFLEINDIGGENGISKSSA